MLQARICCAFKLVCISSGGMYYFITLFPFFKQVESMNAQYSYNEKRLDSLKAASKPKPDEVRRMKELDSIISDEQVELDRLTKCSSKLKDQASS